MFRQRDLNILFELLMGTTWSPSGISTVQHMCWWYLIYITVQENICLYNENLINDNCIWRTRYRNELYMLYDELDMLKVVKIGRLRWLGHLFRTQELDICRKLTLLKQEGTWHVGKPKLSGLHQLRKILLILILIYFFIPIHPYNSGMLDMEHVNKKHTYYQQNRL